MLIKDKFKIAHSDNSKPYPGLRPYQENEKNNFFGRDTDRDILIKKILNNRLTLLFSATGVGKSSLLQASVIPKLKDPKDKNLTVIYHNDWVLDPIESLKETINHAFDQELNQSTGKDAVENSKQKTLSELLEFCVQFTHHPLIIILDQFEEFFRYQKQGDKFDEFINQLTSLVVNTKIPLSILISMREDFALELDAFKPKLPIQLFENYHRLNKLDEQAARDAIQIPAQQAGFSYEPDLFNQLLKDLLSRDLDRAPNMLSVEVKQFVEPPYIQIVCGQLWELEKDNPDKILRLKTYQNKGGAKGLLVNYVNDELGYLSTSEKDIASHAFDHLVSRRGTKMPHTVEDLAPLINKDEKDLTIVFQKLTTKRILRSQKRANKVWYELYHDMFSQVIEDWNLIWKAKMRNRRFTILLTSIATVLFGLYAGFDYLNNKNNYQLLSKYKSDDYLEVYQGKLGSQDLFKQKDYFFETAYQRRQIEPDKCVTACGVVAYQDLNSELIRNLPLLDRIAAYAEDGQFSKAFELAEKMQQNKKTSLTAIKRLADIRINAVLPKLAYQIEYSKYNKFRETVRKNMPVVSINALFPNTKITKEFISKSNKDITIHLKNHPDWVKTKHDFDIYFYAAKKAIKEEPYADLDWFNYSFLTAISFAGKSSIKSIIKATTDNEDFVRRSAVYALGQIKSDLAIPSLIKTLKHKHEKTRLFSVQALGNINKPRTIPFLIEALEDKSVDVRLAAISALAPTKNPLIIKPLIKLMEEDNSGKVRTSADEALRSIKHNQELETYLDTIIDSLSSQIFSPYFTVPTLMNIKRSRAIEPLINLLSDKDKEARRLTVLALMELEIALESQSPDQASNIENNKYLSTIKKKNIIQHLIKTLDDENNEVRTTTTTALGTIESMQAVKPLIKRLKNDDYKDVRIAAASALGKIKSFRAVKPLINALQNDDNKEVRKAVASALGDIRSVRAIIPLSNALDDADENVRIAAATSLETIGSIRAVKPLINALNKNRVKKKESDAISSALGAIGGDQAQDFLIKQLENEHLFIRNSAASELTMIENNRVIKALITALDDDDENIRSSVVNSLGSLRNSQAINPLIKKLYGESDLSLTSIARELSKIKSTQSTTHIIKLFNYEYSFSLEYIAESFGRLQNILAVEPLIEALTTEEEFELNSFEIALGELKSPSAIGPLSNLIFDKYTSSTSYFGKGARTALIKITAQHKLSKIKTWIEKIEKQFPIKNDTDTDTDTKETISPQLLNQKINNSKLKLANRLDALDSLMTVKPTLAKQTLLKLLSNQDNESKFGARLYPYLADLKAVEALDTIEQRLNKLDHQGKEWRSKRDQLDEDSSDENREKVIAEKPKEIISAYVYASTIARLDTGKGIKLLQHNLAEARRGAWEGLAQLADVELVKKLDKIHQGSKENPILHHAVFRAIDLSLVTINANLIKKDRDSLDAYLKLLNNTGRIVTSKDLTKNDPVAMRIEWTRDRINEGLKRIKQVECRAEHWFEMEWFEGCP